MYKAINVKYSKMEFNGTQGEWKVRKTGKLNDVYNQEESNWFIAQDINPYDAQLIATAPELLKELQKIKLDIDLGIIEVRKSSPIYQGIVRVIDKALKQT
jgi:hypothetical protein